MVAPSPREPGSLRSNRRQLNADTINAPRYNGSPELFGDDPGLDVADADMQLGIMYDGAADEHEDFWDGDGAAGADAEVSAVTGAGMMLAHAPNDDVIDPELEFSALEVGGEVDGNAAADGSAYLDPGSDTEEADDLDTSIPHDFLGLFAPSRLSMADGSEEDPNEELIAQ